MTHRSRVRAWRGDRAVFPTRLEISEPALPRSVLRPGEPRANAAPEGGHGWCHHEPPLIPVPFAGFPFLACGTSPARRRLHSIPVIFTSSFFHERSHLVSVPGSLITVCSRRCPSPPHCFSPRP